MNGKEPSPSTRPGSAGRSRLLLAVFGGLILLTAAVFVSTGLYLREDLREMGGPLHISVENRHEGKLRVDLYLRGQFAVLELEPGRGGMIRFNPEEPTPLEIQILRQGVVAASVVEDGFLPGREEDVTVIVNSPSSLRVTRELRAGSEPGGRVAELPE